MRRRTIFILTHLYPLFLAGHLWLGNKSRFSIALLTVVPLIIFVSLFMCWVSTSHIRLTKTEKFNLKYLAGNIIFISCYYVLCICSLPAWAYDKNHQVLAFISITLIFYILNHEQK